MAHATMAFDLEKHGEDGLAATLRNLPVGGSVKLLHSGLAVERIGGGRLFRLSVPPRVTERLPVNPDDMKSVKTAAPALVSAHQAVLKQVDVETARAANAW